MHEPLQGPTQEPAQQGSGLAWQWTDYRLRIALVVASLACLAWFLFVAREVLLPIVFGLIFILVVNPMVGKIERVLPPRKGWVKMRRFAAIVIVYLVFVLLAVGFAASLAPVLINQGGRFLQDYPQMIESARITIESMFGSVLGFFSPELRLRAGEFAQQSLDVVVRAGTGLAVGLGQGLTGSLGLVIAFLSIPVWSFYVLMDRDTLRSGFLRLFPVNMRNDAENLSKISARVLGSYFRSQMVLGLIVGFANFVGMALLGIPYAPLLGVVAGVGEVLPVIGPWLAAIIALLVALAMEPSKLIGVGLVALGVQMAENYLLVPKIQGWSLRLHPAVIIILLVLGSEVAGLWGAILIIPMSALARDIFIYLYQRWSEPRQLAEHNDLLVSYQVPDGRRRVHQAIVEVGAQAPSSSPTKKAFTSFTALRTRHGTLLGMVAGAVVGASLLIRITASFIRKG